MAGGRQTGQKFKSANTCPISMRFDSFESHRATDREYIRFLAVGALWAEILSPGFWQPFAIICYKQVYMHVCVCAFAHACAYVCICAFFVSRFEISMKLPFK